MDWHKKDWEPPKNMFVKSDEAVRIDDLLSASWNFLYRMVHGWSVYKDENDNQYNCYLECKKSMKHGGKLVHHFKYYILQLLRNGDDFAIHIRHGRIDSA